MNRPRNGEYLVRPPYADCRQLNAVKETVWRVMFRMQVLCYKSQTNNLLVTAATLPLCLELKYVTLNRIFIIF